MGGQKTVGGTQEWRQSVHHNQTRAIVAECSDLVDYPSENDGSVNSSLISKTK